MSEAAAPQTAETTAETAESGDEAATKGKGKAAAKAPEPDAPAPKITKVEQLRQHFRDRRAIREGAAVAVAADKGVKTRVERDAAAKEREQEQDAKRASLARGAKPKDETKAPAAEAKPEPKKDAAPERDETGRFLPKDGKPAPKPAQDDDRAPPPAAAKAADAKTEARIEATSEKLEDLGVKVPEQGKHEEDKRYEARIARLLLDAREKDAKLRAAEDRAKAADERAQKVSEYEKLLERVRADELDEDALEQITGKSWVDLIKGVASGERKFKPKTRLPPELQRVQNELEQTLAKAREREEAIERARRDAEEEENRKAAEAQRSETRKREVGVVQKFLEENAEQYPQAAAIPSLSEKLLDRWYAKWAESNYDPSKQPELSEVATEIEALLQGEVSGIVSSERALKAALKDPKTLELVVRVVSELTSQSKQSPQRENKGSQSAHEDGPRTLSKKVTQESVPTERAPSVDERRARQLENFARWRAGKLTLSR